MPNGGSDCCGTCWFNRANRGEMGSGNHDHSIPSHCEIRDLAIEYWSGRKPWRDAPRYRRGP